MDGWMDGWGRWMDGVGEMDGWMDVGGMVVVVVVGGRLFGWLVDNAELSRISQFRACV